MLAALARFPISDGTGRTIDEVVATIGLVSSFAVGFVGVRMLEKQQRRVGWVILVTAIGMAGASFVLPARLLRPQQAKVRIASPAALEVVSPLQDQSVHGRSLEVIVRLSGGRISQRTTTNLRPDEGHIHVWIDGTLVSKSVGLTQLIDISTLRKGSHTLLVEFVALDHGPFKPRVAQVVTFLVS